MTPSGTLTITGGRVICDATSLWGPADLFVDGGCISRIAPTGEAPPADTTIDATDMIVAPGLVDVHLHLREPGGEHKETIASGTRAALMGGSLMAIYNFSPSNVETQ